MNTKVKSNWPTFCQTFVKWLVKQVLKEDVERLRSNSVSLQLKLDTLWSAGVRVFREYGYTTGPGDINVARSEVEWIDLHSALNSVKSVEPLTSVVPHSGSK